MISVAKNLSNGEGFVQDTAGGHQFSFWFEDFDPDFPAKTRHTHSIGVPLLIFAVAELSGLGHTDAAYALSAACYGLALLFLGALAFRLWGFGGMLLAISAVPLMKFYPFTHPMTEAPAVVFLLACMAALASPAGAWKFFVAGLLAACCVLTRKATAPLFILGAVVCLLEREKPMRALGLFAAGCALFAVRPLVGEGLAYRMVGLQSITQYPRVPHLLDMAGKTTADIGWGVAALAGLAWAMLARHGGKVFALPDFRRGKRGKRGKHGKHGRQNSLLAAQKWLEWLREHRAMIILPCWSAGFPLFILASGMFIFFPIDFRQLYPAKITMAALAGGMLWVALAGAPWRKSAAVLLFVLSMGGAIVRDLHAIENRKDVSDAARIAMHPSVAWAAENIRPDDFLIAVDGMLYPHYLDQLETAVSFTGPYYEPYPPAEHMNRAIRHRCGKFGRFFLIMLRGTPLPILTVPNPPAVLVAETQAHQIIRLTHCD